MHAVEELRRLSGLRSDWDWSRAAVIAREWKYLEPVRSFCEAESIPTQIANESQPNFWRLRETQSLVSWLRQRERSAIHVSELVDWIDLQSVGPWWSVLREGIDEFARDVGDRDTDRSDVLEALAEWGRDIRSRQNGLLLLTAHRAKGLEFDNVVVLDGAWEKRSRNEDPDAVRRLLYVAMTRARQNLLLMFLGERHPLLSDGNSSTTLVRSCSPVDVSKCKRRYMSLGPADVDLDFLGRFRDGAKSISAVAGLKTGDVLSVTQDNGRWVLTDADATPVCRLAKRFSPPTDRKLTRANVRAILIRTKEDSRLEFQKRLKQDRWSAVLPDMVFD